MDPADVADQLDLSLAQVHLAMAYFYAHPDEMAAVHDRHEELMAEAREHALDPLEKKTQ